MLPPLCLTTLQTISPCRKKIHNAKHKKHKSHKKIVTFSARPCRDQQLLSLDSTNVKHFFILQNILYPPLCLTTLQTFSIIHFFDCFIITTLQSILSGHTKKLLSTRKPDCSIDKIQYCDLQFTLPLLITSNCCFDQTSLPMYYCKNSILQALFDILCEKNTSFLHWITTILPPQKTASTQPVPRIT